MELAFWKQKSLLTDIQTNCSKTNERWGGCGVWMINERCLATNCSRKWFSVVQSVPMDKEISVKVSNGLIGCSGIDPDVLPFSLRWIPSAKVQQVLQ